MKHLPVILLAALGVVAHAQQAPEDAQYIRASAPFGQNHVQAKHKELLAIGRRVQRNLRIENARHEIQYDKNRRECQAALRVAQECGKFAGTFYCDAKGFQPIAPNRAIKPAAMDNASTYRMERCVLEAAKRR